MTKKHKTLFAKVFAQRDPVPVRTFRVGNDEFTEYAARLEPLGEVFGSYSECWSLAKVMHPIPVLQFVEE